MFVGREVGAHSHVQGDHLPLGVAVGARGAEVMAVPAVLGPQLSAARFGGLPGGRSGAGRWRRGGASSDEANNGQDDSGEDCGGA